MSTSLGFIKRILRKLKLILIHWKKFVEVLNSIDYITRHIWPIGFKVLHEKAKWIYNKKTKVYGCRVPLQCQCLSFYLDTCLSFWCLCLFSWVHVCLSSWCFSVSLLGTCVSIFSICLVLSVFRTEEGSVCLFVWFLSVYLLGNWPFFQLGVCQCVCGSD